MQIKISVWCVLQNIPHCPVRIYPLPCVAEWTWPSMRAATSSSFYCGWSRAASCTVHPFSKTLRQLLLRHYAFKNAARVYFKHFLLRKKKVYAPLMVFLSKIKIKSACLIKFYKKICLRNIYFTLRSLIHALYFVNATTRRLIILPAVRYSTFQSFSNV